MSSSDFAEAPGKRILFQLTGSIAAYKACAAISRLVQDGFAVQTVATRAALEFVGEATLEGLTGRPVFTDIHERGRRMDHVTLAKAADLAIVCPASANTLNRLAAGLADDPIGALFLAYDLSAKPYWVAPAMNSRMFAHPATQAALSRLEAYGVRVLPVESGPLACGEIGEGRMMEPGRVVEEIRKCLSVAS